MTARFAKEARDLFPTFAGTVVLIVAPYFIWPREAGFFGTIIFALGCAIMGANVFGSELHHRTLGLLLSQPALRSQLWWEKMRVLAVGLALAALAFAFCLAFLGTDGLNKTDIRLLLYVVPVCAFCGGPCLTLLAGSGLAGTVFAVMCPLLVLGAGALAGNYLVGREFMSDVGVENLMALLLAAYCLSAYLLGYRIFKRWQAVEGAPRQLGLPPRLETALTRSLSRSAAGPVGAFEALVRKDLRLQQVTFLLTGLFCAVALVGMVLYWARSSWAEWLLAPDFFLYLALLPFLVGAVSGAEERGWGVAAWQLTLPASALKQWLAKVAVAFCLSLVLGLLLPWAAWGIGVRLLAVEDGRGFPPLSSLPFWVLGQWLVVSLALYTGTFCRSVLKAILLAMALILTGAWGVAVAVRILDRTFVGFPSGQYSENQVALLAGTGLVVLIGLVQRLAFYNFRRLEVPASRVAVQVLILLAVGILTALLVLNQSMR